MAPPIFKEEIGRTLVAVASTTSTVASLRVARLGWLPRQAAKLPMHDGWQRTRKLCHWPWNILRHARSSSIQTWIALGKIGPYLQLCSFTFFALYDLYSGCKFTGRRMQIYHCLVVNSSRHAGHTHQPHVLQRHIYGWAKWFVNYLTWATPRATSIQVQRGSRTWNKFAPREASKQSPSHKPLQPTLWECNWMIACTHHAAFDVWTLGLAKAFAALRLSMINYHLQTEGFFYFCSQNLVCYPWVSKCTDRSRWSLATVTSGHGHPSVLGATAIVEYQP